DIDSISETYSSIAQQSIEQAKAAVVDAMVSPLSATISRVIAFALIFLICCIAVWILWWLSDFIINLPVIRQLDKLGGVVFGVLNSFLIAFVVVAVLNVGSGYLMKDRSLESRQKITENTMIYKHFNEYNPLNAIFVTWE
ncbi:MAG: CvpA family protein, partial [Clostridia bacterium]|nr:CvpA family protein [Clostridia bacterium]